LKESLHSGSKTGFDTNDTRATTSFIPMKHALRMAALSLSIIIAAACGSSGPTTDASAFKYEYFFTYVKKSDYENVRKALRNGFRIDQCDYAGKQAIHWAVINNDGRMMLLLLDHGADINARNRDGDTPLFLFLRFGTERHDDEMIRSLLRNGADVNAKNNAGQTPLHQAAMWGTFERAAVLVRNGAHVNARDHSGNTPLHMAARWGGRSRIAALLLENGAEVNPRGELFTTPLRQAILSGDEKTIALLKERGAEDFGVIPVRMHKALRNLFFLR